MSEPEWNYARLRRYRTFLERSIDEEIRWAVFEPNDEPLWARVREWVSDFLTAELERGALVGTKPEQAFFVRCDRTTMTQDDIDSGRLVCLIGVALLRPAEFVLLRIGQWRAELTPPERTRFFAGQLLTAADLEREQTYALERRRLHNRLLHRAGVVAGLGVTADGAGSVVVGPGVALDRLGREIVVPAAVTVPIDATPSRIGLSYAEEDTDRGTILETYEVRALADVTPWDDELVLAIVEDDGGSLRVGPPEGDPTP